MCDLRHRWILALQARLGAVATRRPSLLALPGLSQSMELDLQVYIP